VHHVVLERWSRGSSPLHRRDPRAKLFALAVFLVTLATARRNLPILAPLLFALLALALLRARIPLGSALLRAGVVFSFTAPFAVISYLIGDPARAAAMLLKSYLSALAVLLVVSTTPIPALLRGLEALGAPRFLLMVAQFLYRYLFVISEEAQHMRKAALARGATTRATLARHARFQAAAGAVGALFARSYGRAEDIHRAMLARGFSGRFPVAEPLRFVRADALFATLAAVAPVLARFTAERIA
jgi:cobalt/nickel transport system permease protein